MIEEKPDYEFLNACESCRLPKSNWNHQAHLRLSFNYALTYPFEVGISRLRETIRSLNIAHGVRNSKTAGYHETLTIAWHTIIFHVTKAREVGSFSQLLSLSPEIFSPDYVFSFYSSELISNPYSRTKFVAPDIRPLPKLSEKVAKTYFFISPIGTEGDEIRNRYEYVRDLLRSVIEELDGNFVTPTSISSSVDATEKVIEQISEANLVFADISTDNPNVFFEVGVALSLSKPVTLLSTINRIDKKDVPFDASTFDCIPLPNFMADYQNDMKTFKEHERIFIEKVKKFCNNPNNLQPHNLSRKIRGILEGTTDRVANDKIKTLENQLYELRTQYENFVELARVDRETASFLAEDLDWSRLGARADDFIRKKKYEEARKTLLRQMQETPEKEREGIYYKLALCRYYQKDFREACKFVAKSLDLNPTFEKALILKHEIGLKEELDGTF